VLKIIKITQTLKVGHFEICILNEILGFKIWKIFHGY